MKLRDYADLLEQQGADGFRERAYRKAAETVAALPRPVADILEQEGRAGLIALPGIGKGIAGAIAELVVSGRWSQLERLRGELSPEKLFQTIPGIGPKLAARLADEMHLETLEDLEAALHLGDVRIAGLGPRRSQAIAAVLAERLGRPVFRREHRADAVPGVDLILEIDARYRERAAAGSLRRIAPKRFNPTGEAWLPVMHARLGEWQFTALFSNTALAHQLGRNDDWVVIYFESDGHAEGRCTVVTETRGPLAGRRVVRGREEECAQLNDDR
ncbi:helix-hairpin-helix domain-containing protein [Breoghania sp. L-A4]|uniref:helix-hairpin-helix domain-containing protein n=1 Tax=Breoghania sp. L-A4 TaxID=2304600 RepID=UPI0020BEAA95|nr:helix-hairpin-helix domain-containing protein [Breoghania sp. L-A4]